jgi:hypothetical protein
VRRLIMLHDDEDSLDEDVRRVFVSLRAHPSACPSSEQLVEFHDGTLAAEERRAIVDHVVVCGTCDLLLERIKSSEEGARAATIPPAEWRTIDRRLTRSFQRSLGDRGNHMATPRGFAGRIADLVWHPAVAYALALILCYPAYLGMWPRPRDVPEVQLEERSRVKRQASPTSASETLPAVQHARSFDLTRTRGLGGAGGTGHADGPSTSSVELRLSPQDTVFILTFFIPARLDRHYAAFIIGGDGRIAVGELQAGGGEQGSYSLVCQHDSFPPGEYSLIVKEIAPADGRVSRQFTFHFRL